MQKRISSIGWNRCLSGVCVLLLSVNTVFSSPATVTVKVVGQLETSLATITVPVVILGTGTTSSAPSTVISNVVSATTCSPLLTTYNKLGSYGPEVAKLQKFLNEKNGAKLNGLGYFGPVTMQEVRNLQYTYGIKPTGNQYELTTLLINRLHCGKIPLRQRKVYASLPGAYVTVKPAADVGTSVKVVAPPTPTTNVGVAGTKNLVKDYEVPKSEAAGHATATPPVKTDTNAGLSKDLNDTWERIKNNYKAYLLVFALVLALFWFLRKAVTE